MNVSPENGARVGRRHGVAVAAMALAMAGASCKTLRERAATSDGRADAATEVRDVTREVVSVDDLPPELRGPVLEQARRSADAGEDARVTLLRAWNYAPPPELDPTLNLKMVAVELQVDIPGTGFDLDDLDIVDVATGENHGSDPLLQRLTAAGEPIDFGDPAAGDDHHFHLLAVWAVPATVRRIRIDYWGRSISGEIDVRGTRPALRVIDGIGEHSAPIAHGVGPADATGARSHYLVVECFCARVAPVPYLQLVAGDELLGDRRSIDVGPTLAPLTTPLDQRPFYGRRTWLIEYRGKPGATITAVNDFGEHVPLPRRSVAPGPAARAALAALPFGSL